MSGEVPDGWQSLRFGDVIRSFAGGTPSRSNAAYYGPGMPWLKSGEVRAGRITIVEEQITELGLRESSARIAKAGSPVIAMYGATAGVAGILEIDAALNQAVLAIEPVAAKLNNEFCFHLLSAEAPRLLGMTQGSGQPNLSKGLIDGLNVDLPPLDEQRRIADVLRSVDEAIAQIKFAAEQASRAIEGMLQRLFVEGIGHTAFKAGHSSAIPITWEEKPLGELSATPITYGVVQPGDNAADGVRLIRGGDFPNGRIDPNTLRTIGNDIAEQYRRTQLCGGEVLVSLVGYPGACAVVPQSLAGANVNRAVAVIRVGEAVTAGYLYHFIRSPVAQARLMKETIGSAQQVINLRDLKEIMVAVPPKREQEQIVAILANLDAFVELEKANLAQLTTLKISLAADLLSGRVRVPA